MSGRDDHAGIIADVVRVLRADRSWSSRLDLVLRDDRRGARRVARLPLSGA